MVLIVIPSMAARFARYEILWRKFKKLPDTLRNGFIWYGSE